MSEGRKTKVLKFNLYDRGRKLTGIDRSNVNMKKMIELINHPETQERVRLGDMLGYFGHEIRQRWGMIPPDAVTTDGKVTPLEPAFKTILFKASPNGDVEHQAEFLNTTIGEYARQQYKAKVGGFSQAVTYKQVYGNLEPYRLFGFDYVNTANFVSNVGDGVLFDGLCLPEVTDMISCFDSATNISELSPQTALIARLLEQQVIQSYDHANSQLQLINIANNAMNQVEELNTHIFNTEKRKELQEKRQQELYTGMVGEIRSFDSVVQEAEQNLQQMQNTKPKAENKITEKVKKVAKNFFRYPF